jgi:SLT domain-containing protein
VAGSSRGEDNRGEDVSYDREKNRVVRDNSSNDNRDISSSNYNRVASTTTNIPNQNNNTSKV